MKKTLITCLILSAAFLVMALPMQAAVRYVVPPGGTPLPGEYATIQAAVTAAVAGDTIAIAAGTYAESVSIGAGKGNLTIQGAGRSVTTIDPPLIGTSGYCFYVDPIEDGLTVTDMTLKNKGNSNAGSGVWVQNGKAGNTAYLICERLDIVGTVDVNASAGHGIVLNNASVMANVAIRNCTITKCGTGIRVADNFGSVDGLTVDSCHVDNNMYGFQTYNSKTTAGRTVKNVTINNSTFNGNKHKGIYCERLTDSTLSNLQVINSGRTDGSSGTALNLNLKYQAYQNLSLSDIVVSSLAAPAPQVRIGVDIQGNAGYLPVSVNNVTLERVNVSGCAGWTGINIGPNVTGATMHHGNIENNSAANLVVQGGATVDATLNWWGTDDAAAIASKISGLATYIEFLCEPYPTAKVSVNGKCCTPTDLNGNDGIDNNCNGVIDEAAEDKQAPVPNVDPLPTVSGQCSATVTAPTATDSWMNRTITGTTTDPLTYTAQGEYTVTWTYDDGNGNTAQQTQTVVVKDTIAPVANVDPLPTVSGQCSATIASAPTATDNCKGAITGTTTDPLTYTAQGTYTVTWTYDDGNGNTSQQTQTVVVKDTIAPTVSCNLVASLWPPNHNMVNVGTITATDNCGGAPIIAVTVTQDEPVEDKTGDGKFSPDASGTSGSLSLRAERKGNGDGRVYCITVTATDAAGNVGTCSSTVTVPHSQSKPAVNSGCIYPSSGPVIGPKQ